ncbi:MAG: discoidin domain-containing protein [Oscillospiraceae bacterium]|nr:discoidin domain-containing protein [Oscillospiraceae bacterium]
MTKGFWGTAVADHDQNKIVLSKKYYCFGQYTRYIRPGMTMLNCSGNTMAAYDKEKEQLVIVSYNTSPSASDQVYDLSSFAQVGTEAQTIRTSNSEEWKDLGATKLNGTQLSVSLAPSSVTTFVIDGVKGAIERENKIDLAGKKVTGTDSWHSEASTSCEKAFDSNKATYFDGVGDGYTQIDLGESYDFEAFGYCPRSGFEARAIDGMIQVSEDGENWTTAYTITGEPGYGMHYVQPAEPVHGRYVRYAVPSGAPKNGINTDNVYCCNIAEIELYGTPHTAEPIRLKGDADANGKIEIADAVMLLKYLLTSGDVSDAEAADMNEDGVLNVTDLTMLKTKLLG